MSAAAGSPAAGYAVHGGAGRRAAPVKVVLNVYDLVPNNWGHALGFGLYHSGVEINGQEYSFYGGDQAAGGGGVISTPPRVIQPPAKYRESIEMGEICMTSSELKQVINKLSREFPGESYHITARNCNSFCDALCMELLGKHIPKWINRAAWAAGPLLRHWMPGSSTPVSGPSPTAFSGTGYKLSSSDSSPSRSLPAPSPAVVLTNAGHIPIDESQPTTTIQVRLHDGTKVHVTLNHTHTIDDVKKYIDCVCGNIGSYSLLVLHPRRALDNTKQTLAQADLLNAVLIQQLK